MSSDRWPLRYRLAHRAHCYMNRLHRASGNSQVTGWLNCKVGSLWINWWIKETRRDDGVP